MPASTATIYAYDPDSQGFFPMSLPDNNYDPFSIIQYEPLGDADESDVILGCRDGYPRQLDNAVFQDDGTSFTSYVVIGPIQLGTVQDGLVQQIDAALTNASGDVTWELYVGRTLEDSIDTSGSAKATGTWVAGFNNTARPRVRGRAFTLKLINGETNDGWSFEEIDTITLDVGRRRA